MNINVLSLYWGKNIYYQFSFNMPKRKSIDEILQDFRWHGAQKPPGTSPLAHPCVYPYMLTKLTPSLYHATILPNIGADQLIKLVRLQEVVNQLPTCLVLGENSAIYLDRGVEDRKETIPMGGALVTGKLFPYFEIRAIAEADSTYWSRINVLGQYIKEHDREGCLFGDLTKGGLKATENEIASLSGYQSQHEGVPLGLHMCEACKLFRGRCLDPNEKFKGQIMLVHCVCENENACARCRQKLYRYKLNANYYDRDSNTVQHVPGFSGLSHDCEESKRVIAKVEEMMEASGELHGLDELDRLDAIASKCAIPEVWMHAAQRQENDTEDEPTFSQHQRHRLREHQESSQETFTWNDIRNELLDS